jgi:putative ABC transport system permease protein
MKYINFKQIREQLRQNRFFTFLSLFGVSIPVMIVMVMIVKTELYINPGGPEKDNDQMLFLNRTKIRMEEGRASGFVNLGIIEKYFSEIAPKGSMAFSSSTLTAIFLENEVLDVPVRYTNADFWDIFDFHFVDGSHYNLDNVSNKDNVVVISRNLSRKVFGMQEAVGKTMEVEGGAYRIIGVVEEVTSLAMNAYSEIWMPYTVKSHRMSDPEEIAKAAGGYSVAFRASEHWDFDQIKSDVERVRTRLNQINGEDAEIFFGGPAPATENYFRGFRDLETYEGNLLNFLAIAGKALMILFLPALNLMSLNLTRIQERSQEIAIRKAFGATRKRMALQIMGENAVLTILGGLIGLLMAYMVMYFFKDQVFAGVFIRNADQATIQINYVAFLLVMGVSLVFSILSGLIPSLRISRLQPAYVLKGGEL